ncbi:hypothetical protein JHE06_05280 [Carnobacterium sp. CS13]|uniref:hypothetical protein n=1 Tax=Carnobacterium sp. CS13 TaxID=2800128 RepID=UPI0019137482|nr:hypothetical protein [Carnobacterium sp. CS13]QQP71183.1 hypothetical protein JHE06_05280 [Carnobacterium sp. CS13]
MENIKEALEYAVDLGNNEEKVIKSQSKEYYDERKHQLVELDPKKYAKSIKLNTLTGLVEYIKSGRDELLKQNLTVHVVSPTEVKVFTELDEERSREVFIITQAELPTYRYARFHSLDEFNIQLQSVFVKNEDRDLLLEFASAVHVEKGATVSDNGINQSVTIKNGVSSLATGKAPNPVELKPYRTFLEVDQPESLFVFRLNDEPGCALFEADGGLWKHNALANIKEYLQDNLKELKNVEVIA